MNTDFSEYTFKQLAGRESQLVLDLNQEFASRRVDHCFQSLSPQQSDKIQRTVEELSAVLQEMEKRREGFKTDFLGVSYKTYMIVLKALLHSSYFSAIALDFASLFLDCETAEKVEFASISCSTAAVALTIINGKAEEVYEKHRKKKARRENCSVEDLEGVLHLDRFLKSFVKLVRHIQELQKAKGERLQKAVVDRKLVAICIADLQKIPDHMLEVQTGERAEDIKYNWSCQIAAMANIHYAPPSIPRSASAGPASAFAVVDLPDSEFSIDYSKMSLHALMRLYKEEIASFYSTFKFEDYLQEFVADKGLEGPGDKRAYAQKERVDGFIKTIGALHQEVCKRRERLEQVHCCPCLSTKIKLNFLYVVQHTATVTFFSSTSLMSVIHCEEHFGGRQIVKIVEIVSGTVSSIFQGITSWVSSRELDNKIGLASLMNVEIDDLEGIQQLNVFVENFLKFVELLTVLRDLKIRYNNGWEEKAFNPTRDYQQPGEFEKFSDKEIKAAAKELFHCLSFCCDAFGAIDSQFLEQLFKVNGEVIKDRWKNELEAIYRQETDEIALKPKYRLQGSPRLRESFGCEEKNEGIEGDGFLDVFSECNARITSLAKQASEGGVYNQTLVPGVEERDLLRETLEENELEDIEREEEPPRRRRWQENCAVL